MILVTGYPRSGTMYMAKLLQAFGFDVKHEEMGADGTACWSWATHDKDPPWAPGMRRHEKRTLIHVMRDPFAVLQSVVHTEKYEESRSYRRKYSMKLAGGDDWNNAVLSMCTWHYIIKAQNPDLVVRVEEAPESVAEFFDKDIPEKLPSTDTHTRKYDKESIASVLVRLRPDIREMLLSLCMEQGYEV